jgi:hypothetical protein
MIQLAWRMLYHQLNATASTDGGLSDNRIAVLSGRRKSAALEPRPRRVAPSGWKCPNSRNSTQGAIVMKTGEFSNAGFGKNYFAAATSLTRIRRMTHKYIEGQVRFSYDNQ